MTLGQWQIVDEFEPIIGLNALLSDTDPGKDEWIVNDVNYVLSENEIKTDDVKGSLKFAVRSLCRLRVQRLHFRECKKL